MKKKILILTLCIALLAAAAVGGTLAYFTDTDEVTNTFTVGNVKIELLESKLLRTANITDEAIAADAEGYATYLAQAGKNILPGISVKKAPYIRNTGSNNAYVLRMLIPVELVDIVTCVYTNEAIADDSVTEPVKLANVTVDGVEYAQFAFVYNDKLAPEAMTYWPVFSQVKLNEHVTSEDVAGLTDATFNIILQADAIQADTFETAAAAFAAFDAQD